MSDPTRQRRRLWIALAITLLVWSGVAIAAASLGPGPINRVELPLARWFNGWVGRNETFDRIVLFMNRTPGEATSVVLIFTAYALVARSAGWRLRSIAIHALVVFVFWLAADRLNAVIEHLLPRRSPALVMKDAHVDLTAIYGVKIKTHVVDCFPSSHGLVFLMVFWMSVFAFGKRAVLLLPLCILLSLPRMFGGGHWPSDAFVGANFVALPIAACVSLLPGERGIAGWIERRLARRRGPD